MASFRTKEKFVLGVGVLLLLTLAFGTLARRQSSEAGFEFCGEPSVGANGVVTFPLTNPTHRTIYYLIYPKQLKVNGVWPELQRFADSKQGFLLPRTNTSFSVPAAQLDAAWRVPIIWYHDQSTMLAAMVNRAEFWLTGRRPVWRIVLHTNFSSEVLLATKSKSL
jgi:hypothetical protein